MKVAQSRVRSKAWRKTLWVALWLLLLAPADADADLPDGARVQAAFDGESSRLEARLLLDARPGEPPRAGVLFDIDPEWHLYWKNPGETGLAPEFSWSVEGGAAGPLAWPAPEVFRSADDFIVSYGYSDQVLLASELHLEPGHTSARRIAVEVRFLVCKVDCIPGRLSLERTLPSDGAIDASARELFERYAARVPVDAARAGIDLEASFAPSPLQPGADFEASLSIRCADLERCEPLRASVDPIELFVPEAIPGITLRARTVRPDPRRSGALLMTLTGSVGLEPLEAESALRGVLGLRAKDGRVQHVAIDTPLPLTAAGPRAEAQPMGLLRVLAFAFLGGVLLNLMPCVLPVLALKLFALVEHSQRRRSDVVVHVAAYGAGVFASMLVLAACVIALRAAGVAVGWGFQLQEPIFVAALAMLMVAFAMNLFGLFEFGTPRGLAEIGQRASGPQRSLFDGLLMVVLATPCSAPFLGTAVGFAFASSAGVVVAVFAAVAAGLAVPFAAAALLPGAVRLLPRPGPWMETLRGVLGFALLGTAAWLLWVLGRAAGIDAAAALLTTLLGVAFGCWVYGGIQRGSRPLLRRPAALGLIALCGLGMAVLSSGIPVAPSGGNGSSQHFDPADVAAQLERGRPVFVYFTADWCITCKLNEHAVLADERVRSELAQLDFAVIKADWTRREETIRAELARFGKAGVPLYLVYAPFAPESPTMLPEILTVETLLRALRDAAPGAPDQRMF